MGRWHGGTPDERRAEARLIEAKRAEHELNIAKLRKQIHDLQRQMHREREALRHLSEPSP